VWNAQYIAQKEVSFKKSIRTRVKEFLISRAVSIAFKRYYPRLAYITEYYPITMGIIVLVMLLLASGLVAFIYTIINNLVCFGA